MASLNKVLLMGNLTRDVEVRHTPTGQALADLGLAVNRKYKDARTNEMREEVTFLNIDIWGKAAEHCAQYLRKGSPVLVEGRLRLETWEKEGQRYSRLKVVAERVQFLPSGQKPAVQPLSADSGTKPAEPGSNG